MPEEGMPETRDLLNWKKKNKIPKVFLRWEGNSNSKRALISVFLSLYS